MPVLYGVFLYMGVASLNGIQVSSPHPTEPRSQLSTSAAILPKPQVLPFPVQRKNKGDKDTTISCVPSKITTPGPSQMFCNEICVIGAVKPSLQTRERLRIHNTDGADSSEPFTTSLFFSKATLAEENVFFCFVLYLAGYTRCLGYLCVAISCIFLEWGQCPFVAGFRPVPHRQGSGLLP